MWPSNPAELRHGICQSNANTRSHRAFERTNSFRPDDRVCRPSTSSSHDQGKVFDDRIWDCDQDDIADDCGGLHYFCFPISIGTFVSFVYVQTYRTALTGNSGRPGSDPTPVQ